MGRGLAPRLEYERALRLAATAHRGQVRKGSGVPYVEHPFAVALILERAGFDDSTAIAGLLHDVVEDTDVTLGTIREAFGDRVAVLVAHGSEVKLDAEGRERPWPDRKRDHLAAIAGAPVEARAVALADKLHNLVSIRLDLAEGRPVWSSFNADRASVLGYDHAMIAACRAGDPRLEALAGACLSLLAEVEAAVVGNRESGSNPP